MAYDASNNQQDQNQVVSSTPLSGGQQPAAQTQPQDSQPNQAPSQPSTVQAGMSSTQAGAAQQPTQQKSASSGMFTNIQKYVQKNKPQAQKMASAVTQNVGSQASEIAEQAKQKEAQMKESLAANTAAMEAQKKEAGQIVGGIMGADYDPTTGQFQTQPAQKPTTIKDMANDPMNGIAISTAKHPNGIPAAGPTGFVDNMPKLIDPKLRDAAQKDFLGDKYDQYKADMDNALNNFVPGNDESLANLAKIEESYGLTGNWFDPYKERSFDYRNNTFKQELTPEEQQARFQELMKGPTGVSEVGNLNIAQQNQRARALQQLAGTANTEMGRRGLLQDTFRQGGKEYTQGMGSLDQLITSGDAQAREALVTGVQDQAQGLQDQLQQVSSDANTAKMAQDMAMKNFGSQVAEMAEDPLSGMTTDMKKAYEDELAARQALFDPESSEYQQAIAGAQAQMDAKRAMLEGGSYADLLEQSLEEAYGLAAPMKGVGRSGAKSTGIEGYIQQLRDFEKTGKVKMPDTFRVRNGKYLKVPGKVLEGAEAQKYLDQGGGTRVTHHKNRAMITRLNDVLRKKLGMDKDLYGMDEFGGKGFAWGENNQRYKQSLGGLRNFYKDQLNKMGSAEDILRRRLESTTGSSLADLQSGADINQYETISDEQVNKMNALKGLLGQQDIITPEMRGDYVKSSDLFQTLKDYMPEDIAMGKTKTGGGSGGRYS
jgi:hypothetical protein